MLEKFPQESKGSSDKKVFKREPFPILYLCANNAAESPHSVVRSVALSCAFQLKEDGHCVTLHLDRFLGPSQSYHSSTSHTERVPTILRYFTTSGCLAGVKNHLRFSDITYVINSNCYIKAEYDRGTQVNCDSWQ